MGKSHPVRYLIFICEKIGKINPPVCLIFTRFFHSVFSRGISLRPSLSLQLLLLSECSSADSLSADSASAESLSADSLSHRVSFRRMFLRSICIRRTLMRLIRRFFLHKLKPRQLLAPPCAPACMPFCPPLLPLSAALVPLCLLLRSRLFLSGKLRLLFLLLRERPFPSDALPLALPSRSLRYSGSPSCGFLRSIRYGSYRK